MSGLKILFLVLFFSDRAIAMWADYWRRRVARRLHRQFHKARRMGWVS